MKILDFLHELKIRFHEVLVMTEIVKTLIECYFYTRFILFPGHLGPVAPNFRASEIAKYQSTELKFCHNRFCYHCFGCYYSYEPNSANCSHSANRWESVLLASYKKRSQRTFWVKLFIIEQSTI